MHQGQNCPTNKKSGHSKIRRDRAGVIILILTWIPQTRLKSISKMNEWNGSANLEKQFRR